MRTSIKRLFLVTITLSLFSNLYGQKVEKVYLNAKNKTSSFYSIIYPPELPWKGFMFLIPGFGETAEDVFLQTNLPKLTAQKGILTIVPTLKTGTLSFGIDSASQQSFREILEHVHDKHNLANLKFFVGGFSIGGSCSIKYAELAVSENLKIKPTAIFAIDPPLDFERFYNSSKRDVRLSTKTEPNQENLYMINRIEQEMNGTPETALTNYHKISPYSFTDTSQTAIKHLIHLPIRIYAEPDVNWWINQRGGDFSSMNVLDASAMINELNKLGNENAFLITTKDKGRRKPNNKRHPHSWSIVDNNELIEWLLNQK